MNHDIPKAIQILQAGGLVAFPTETVYGLGADACQPKAIQKIFQVKNRPLTHPLIVHLAQKEQLTDWAKEIPDIAWQLASLFWPGPLTLILRKASGVLDQVTGGQDTIGLRIPDHPIAQALLSQSGMALAAPSANRFGRISPTTAAAVAAELGDSLDLILDGGSCTVGLESTILDMTKDLPIILRPGMISVSQLEQAVGRSIVLHQSQSSSPRVSGQFPSHYAPVTPLFIRSSASIQEMLLQTDSNEIGFIVHSEFSFSTSHLRTLPTDPALYAKKLYQVLRELDAEKLKYMVVEEVPYTREWYAILDRLQKAACK